MKCSLIALAFSATLAAFLLSPPEAFSQNISEEEYEDGLEWREESVEQSLEEFEDAELNLGEKEVAVSNKEAELRQAELAFQSALDAGDEDAAADLWVEIGVISVDLKFLREEHELAIELHDIADDELSKDRIWLQQFKNDYEAQSNRFAVRDRIANCAEIYCSPASFLSDERFTVFQPNVLEMVGAHHAYAQGLTGAGVRIGIEDDIVNFTLPEFAGRVSFEGATLTYPVPFGDDYFSEPQRCQREEIDFPECFVLPFLSDIPEMETLLVRYIVSQVGWPEEGENWYLFDDTQPKAITGAG